MIKEGNINYEVVNTTLTDEDREQIRAWIQKRKAIVAKAPKGTPTKRSKVKA